MKKIYSILMLAMMAMCVFTLSSCGDDDEFSSQSIIGTWKQVFEEDEVSDGYEFKITFKKDNIFQWKEIYIDDAIDGGKGFDDGSGKYYINGSNMLLIYDDGYEETWVIIYFDGKVMRAKVSSDDSDNGICTFSKI